MASRKEQRRNPGRCDTENYPTLCTNTVTESVVKKGLPSAARTVEEERTAPLSCCRLENDVKSGPLVHVEVV
jgi:hypothetical protein